MSDISTLLANKVRPEFTDPDTRKVYRVSYLTQRKKAEFELWLKQMALSVLKELRSVLTPEEWQAEMRAYRNDCAAGRYFFHGELSEQVRQTIDGRFTLAAMLFECPVEEIIELGQRYPQEVGGMIERVLEESGYRKVDHESNESNESAEDEEGNAQTPAPALAPGTRAAG